MSVSVSLSVSLSVSVSEAVCLCVVLCQYLCLLFDAHRTLAGLLSEIGHITGTCFAQGADVH